MAKRLGNRRRNLRVRVTPTEGEELKHWSELMGVTTSDFIRGKLGFPKWRNRKQDK